MSSVFDLLDAACRVVEGSLPTDGENAKALSDLSGAVEAFKRPDDTSFEHAESDELVRRLTLVGPESDHTDTLSKLRSGDWRIKRTGPYTDKDMYPDMDTSRFLVVAEKQIGSYGS